MSGFGRGQSYELGYGIFGVEGGRAFLFDESGKIYRMTSLAGTIGPSAAAIPVSPLSLAQDYYTYRGDPLKLNGFFRGTEMSIGAGYGVDVGLDLNAQYPFFRASGAYLGQRTYETSAGMQYSFGHSSLELR